MLTTENLVWTFFVAVLVAIMYVFVMQNVMSEFAKRLIQKGANSKENAKTLTELGYKNIFYVKIVGFFAKGGAVISRSVEKLNLEEVSNDITKDLLFIKKKPVLYYIPEENLTKRVRKAMNDKIPIAKLALLVVILIVVALLATSIIDFLKNSAYGLIDADAGNPSGIGKQENTLLENQEELNRLEQEMNQEKEEIDINSEGNYADR